MVQFSSQLQTWEILDISSKEAINVCYSLELQFKAMKKKNKETYTKDKTYVNSRYMSGHYHVQDLMHDAMKRIFKVDVNLYRDV